MDSTQAVDQDLVRQADHTINQSIILTDNRILIYRLVKKNKQDEIIHEKMRRNKLPLVLPEIIYMKTQVFLSSPECTRIMKSI